MRRTNTSAAIALLLVVGIVAACSDMPSAPQGMAVKQPNGRGGLVTAGTCTTLGELNVLAKAVFRTASPNVNSVLGKLRSLDQDVRKGKLAEAVARAHDIVEFTLGHYHAGRLPGTEEELTAFVNNVYCFAGIDIDIDEPSNSHLILPSDQPQIVYSIDNQAAIQFDANPVSEPTLIEFEQLPESPVPGDGPLDTKLDQYPGFLMITKTSETNAPLTKPAVVGVCASGVIPQEVRDRLLLGHGKTAGFEIAAPALAEFLDCENATEAVASAGVLSRLASFLSPRPLQASSVMQFARGGGVGGTVTEFSPFAPVDPVLRSGGGVGGTVTEFTRSPLGNLFANALATLEVCTLITATEGTPVSPDCRPHVRITTRLGTSLTGVPVTWAVTAGEGGKVAQSGAECGGFASLIVAPTDLFGTSAICWKLGAVGANRVEATPAAGGDAPAGVSFEPATVGFDAQATPAFLGLPTMITVLEGHLQTATAGQPTPIAPKVRVTDPYGNPVAGITVHWVHMDGLGSVSPVTSVTDASGQTSTMWTIGLGFNTIKVYIDHTVYARAFVDGTGTAP